MQRKAPLIVPALALGGLAAWDLVLAVLMENQRPLLSRDAVALAFGGAVLVGLPVLVATAVLGLLARRLRRGSGRPPAELIAFATLGLMALGLLVVALTDAGLAATYLRGHCAVLVFVAGSVALGRTASLWRSATRMGLLAAASLVAAVLVAVAGPGLKVGRDESAVKSVHPGAPPYDGKVLLIGVDGLCWETLQRWERQGGSSDLDWFRERASIGPLETFTPTYSPLIWSSVATGVEPRRHGVLGFVSWEGIGLSRPLVRIPRFQGAFYWMRAAQTLGWIRLQPVSSFDLQRPPFWEIIGRSGRRVDVVGWWATWPAQPFQGRLVSDKFYFWRHPEDEQGGELTGLTGTTFPAELEKKLAELQVRPFGASEPEIQKFLSGGTGDGESIADSADAAHLMEELPFALAMDETYYRVAERFLSDGTEDGVFAFYFRGVDLLSHKAMQYSNLYPEVSGGEAERRLFGEVISRYYDYTFSRLRRLVESAGKDAIVILASDHGFERAGETGFDHDNAPPGVLMTLGGGSPIGRWTLDASIYDLAPTVLWLAGYPVADDMPGQPLTELFPEVGNGEEPVLRVATYGGRRLDERATRARKVGADDEQLQLLRSLGYIK